MDYVFYEAAAKRAGFTHTGPLDPATIELKEAVRQMCAACSRYGNCWSCPPACGTLEDCRKRIGKYQQGILLQTVGQLEDEFDGEAMMETEALHKENFHRLLKEVGREGLLALGAGSCTVCKTCSYPDAPCRFPERMVSSMEAYGMEVAVVCRANNLAYYYGPNTIAYTCCLLF